MKKIVIVSILVLILVFSLSTMVKATDVIDMDAFETIENTNTNTNKAAENTPVESADKSVSPKSNPQTGIKEEAPIIIITVLGVCVATYAAIRIKKYNY